MVRHSNKNNKRGSAHLQKISKQEFKDLYPLMWKIYNHSHRTQKFWNKTSHKRYYYVIDNLDKCMKNYWRYNK